MAHTVKNTIATRQVAILVADGMNEAAVEAMKQALESQGAMTQLIALRLGTIKGMKNKNYCPWIRALLMAASASSMPSIFPAVRQAWPF